MMPIEHNTNIERRFPMVHIIVVIGNKNDERKEIACEIDIRKEHFHPHYGWELKDIVIKALPEKFRYLVMKDMMSETNHKGHFHVLFCSR